MARRSAAVSASTAARRSAFSSETGRYSPGATVISALPTVNGVPPKRSRFLPTDSPVASAFIAAAGTPPATVTDLRGDVSVSVDGVSGAKRAVTLSGTLRERPAKGDASRVRRLFASVRMPSIPAYRPVK